MINDFSNSLTEDGQLEPTDTNPRTHTNDMEAAWFLFEQLMVRLGRPVDRSRIRRVLTDHLNARPSLAQGQWWDWLVESSESLGLASKIVDCTVDEMVTLARTGAVLITRHQGRHPWLAVVGSHRRRVEILHPLSAHSIQRMTAREIRREIAESYDDDTVRCVVIDPSHVARMLPDDTSELGTPLTRLWKLLTPESRDLWIILVFAAVSGLLTMATPLAVEALVSTVSFGRLLQPIVVLALILLGFLGFSAALHGLQTWVVEILQCRLFVRVAADLAFRLPRVRIEAFDAHSGRELVNRFFDVVTVQKATAQLMLDGVTLALSTLIGMTILGFYHPWLLGFDVVLLLLIAFAVFV